eukprot:111180_1
MAAFGYQLLIASFFQILSHISTASFLQINGTKFLYNNHEVFLSGVNQPWVSFGSDFGNNQPNAIFCELNYTLMNLTQNYGNSIRMWLHVAGQSSPQFDSNGFVTGTDAANTLISDFRLYLDAAAERNILLFPVLWAGPDISNQQSYNLWGLFNSTQKLQSYIDNALIPMIKAWSDHPALGGIEIINEPEGNLLIAQDNEPCFDTMRLQGTGAGWNGVKIPMKTVLEFIGLQTSAIHEYCPRCLVHVGSWNIIAATDSFGYFNYYKDECIIKSLNDTNNKYTGNVTLDFQSVHNYAQNRKYKSEDPMFNPSDVYKINKPLLIGEFASNSGNLSIEYIYDFLYQNGYVGAWDWAAITPTCNGTLDCMKIMDKGMNNLYQQYKNNGDIKLDIEWNVTVRPRCWCSDSLGGQYTCQQQAIWGKCNETWMAGNCCQSCNACVGCN